MKKRHQIGSQLYKRIVEESLLVKQPSQKKKSETYGNLKNIRFEKIFLSRKSPDNFYMIGQNIFMVSAINNTHKSCTIKSYEVLNLDNFFDIPIKSSLLNIYASSELTLSNVMVEHCSKNIQRKIVMFENYEQNNFVFIPFIDGL